MSGLVLKLGPREQLMINGVIVENGDRKTRLYIKSEGANILRLKDAIDACDATTPIKRAYFYAQQAVAGQLPGEKARHLIVEALQTHYNGAGNENTVSEISGLIGRGDIYRAMRLIGKIAFGEYPAGTDEHSRGISG